MRINNFFPKTHRLLIALLLTTIWLTGEASAARLKDLASIKGVRNNQIIGYGLVVGLNGTGDGNKAGFTTQTLANLMGNMGVEINSKDIKVKNVASVMITAQLPPFAKTGQTIDITISSMGDSTSLKGGTLIVTPLKGLDGNIYAMAQGQISVGSDAPLNQKQHLTVARIPGGATVEKEVPVNLTNKESIDVSINKPDFTTISRMATAINSFLGDSYAKAQDGATLKISVPEKYRENTIGFIASLENLEVTPDTSAKVILNERNGTVVMGEDITINKLALSHGNLSLQITPGIESSIGGNKGDKLVTLKQGATLGDVVRALNAIGATPRDLSAIFQSMKASGALQAELEII
ncbi:MAG: flagellar basal body P-ring protein FlgI [Desulfobulbaceae bacterium]|nr:flagellar basal body P-ring protein FlgI [Desulfobulbaceae bacterium]